jgi:outer membrane protein assembly factor BamA
MQMFMQTIFSFSHVENRSQSARGEGPNFFERHYAVTELLGKRYDQYRRSWFSAGYSYVDVSAPKSGRTVSPDGVDRFLFAGIGGSHDTRDLREYPTEGVYGSASVTKYGFGESAVDYFAVAADWRGYINVYRGASLGMRSFAVVTAGPEIPSYSHQFFGFGERIRGHFTEEREGENIFGASIECRIPIVQSWYLHVPEVPVPQFATWRFGLYAAFFADAGAVWDRGQRAPLAGMPKGYGAGIHFLFPYSAVLRVEHAWDERGRGQFIFDLGASF